MANSQHLSAKIIACPTCRTSLRLNDSEREFGRMIICPNCSESFENKWELKEKKSLPILALIITLFLYWLLSSIVTNGNDTSTPRSTIAGINSNTENTNIVLTASVNPTVSHTALPTVTVSPASIITVNPTARPTVKPTAKPTPKPVSKPAPYACNCAKTCTQIKSCAEAQYQLNSCGCKQRDADHDGIACDGAPLHCQN